LESHPNRFIHAVYKQYVNSLTDPEASKAKAAEEVEEEMREAMGG